jgi:predicted alpha-1,2-mannosidase
VKLGPDFDGLDNAKSGYMPSGNLLGISLMHESGTGGSPKYGTVSQMPLTGDIITSSNFSVKRASPDKGSVGSYSMSLENGVQIAMAGTPHVGYLEYSYPTGQQANIIVNASHYLAPAESGTLYQSYDNGSIQVFADGHYEGNATFQGGWNLAAPWTVHFCGRFSEVASSVQTFTASSRSAPPQFGSSIIASSSNQIGAVFSFNSSNVTSQSSFSFISSSKACQYIDDEIPAGTGLNDLVSASKDVWNTEVLSKIVTTETNTTLLGQLYTSLYGMHILPSNRTGENPNTKWNAQIPYYDDLYTFWDIFRCTTPLYHILQPTMYEDLLRSIVEIYNTEGYMPDARSSNFNGRSQGGSNADNILADAYIKGVRGNVDWTNAYQAMQKDAEVTPPNNHDPLAPDSSTAQGRGALPDWLSLGYITTKFTRSVSRAIEYSANDFGLYVVATGLNKTTDANKYLTRSRNWRNHWNPAAKSFNTSGFLVPRYQNGSFVNQNPASCGGCYWADPYYEGLPWEYTVNPHHDLAAFISMGGGASNFVQRLNTLINPANKLIDMGNEPSFATPYLYNFVNQQPLSVKAARTVGTSQYKMGPGGLPGNSDAGAMQSWLLWNMIGLYPLTGQSTFLIHSPWFANLTISLSNGKFLTITCTGGTSAGGPSDAIYVQSLKVNGQPWTQNWLSWNDVFANGGTMDFILGKEMTAWDANGVLPPSPASGGNQTGISGGPNGPSPLVARSSKMREVDIAVGVVCGVIGLALLAGLAWYFRRLQRRRYLQKRSLASQGSG